MALKRRSPAQKKNEDFTPVENLTPGDYEMRLVYVADLGLQKGMVYQGEQKPDAQQIALGLEVIGETATIDGEEYPRILWTRPINIYDKLTPKGKELVFYKVFETNAKENTVPNWEAQLGKVCTGTVVNTPGTGQHADSVFDNISDIGMLPAKYHANVDEAMTVPAIGDADDENNPCTKALFGLAKWVWANRIDGNKGDEGVDINPDEDLPY